MNVLFKVLVLCVLTLTGSQIVSSAMKPRIVNSQLTDISKYSHQVRLDQSGVHFCGGSLIHDKVVLTAAHCIHNKNVRDIIARIAVNTNYDKDGVSIPFEYIISHENYKDDGTYKFDVAVLVLKYGVSSVINSTANVRPIQIAQDIQQFPLRATIVGWGYKDLKCNFEFPELVCNWFGRYTNLRNADVVLDAVQDDHLRSNSIVSGVTIGIGDSGGPLISNGKLIGIVSSLFLDLYYSDGYSTLRWSLNSYFTNVPLYHKWIVGTLQKGRITL